MFLNSRKKNARPQGLGIQILTPTSSPQGRIVVFHLFLTTQKTAYYELVSKFEETKNEKKILSFIHPIG